MAYGNVTGELSEGSFTKDLRNKAHTGIDLDSFAVGCGDTRALLTAMLKSEKTEEG